MTEDSVDELVHRIRLLASTHGYAIGVHGSLERDVDLIAVPWVRESSSPDDLADAVARALGSRARLRSERVHGRIAYVVDIPGGGLPGYLDLSVISPREHSPGTRRSSGLAAFALVSRMRSPSTSVPPTYQRGRAAIIGPERLWMRWAGSPPRTGARWWAWRPGTMS